MGDKTNCHISLIYVLNSALKLWRQKAIYDRANYASKYTTSFPIYLTVQSLKVLKHSFLINKNITGEGQKMIGPTVPILTIVEK